MNYKEQKETLSNAIQILMELYQDISIRAEPFTMFTNSELKKMSITY